MNSIEMSVSARDTKGMKPKDLLKSGLIPGIVYGHGVDNISVQIAKKEFTSIFREAGESSLLTLKVDGKVLGNVIINDYQTDPLTDEVIHFDLHKVRMDEKITTNVNIILVGEAPAVKDLGGVLVIGHDSIEIKCLPQDLIHEIDLDLSTLTNLDDMIRVKDLNLSSAVEVLSEEEDVLVSVVPPRSEAEMEDLEEKPEENIESVEGAIKETPEADTEKKKEDK